MIYKMWKKSIEIRKLEALLRRLPIIHPKRAKVEKDYARKIAGYKGEVSLDYYLSFLSEKEYFIFYNLRLKDKLHYFQIDTLLISLSFILIIESKNMSGTLFFDHANKQLIRTLNEITEVFPDPVQQVKRQQIQLRNWLNN